MRVMLRYREDAASLRDVVGELTDVTDGDVTVLTRRGPVRVRRVDVVTGKELPPPPQRRARPHRQTPPVDLQELMVAGMPPLRRDRLGGWLLRAADGYTGRANSALVLGDPGVPLEDAVGRLRAWSAEHGIPPLLQIIDPPGGDPAADPLVRALGAGWEPFQRTLVMTAPTRRLLPGQGATELSPVVAKQPTHDWFAGLTAREQQHESTLRAMLDHVARQRFLTLHGDDGTVAGAMRVALHDGWAGVFALHVRPDLRGRGLARGLMHAAAGLSEHEAPSTYLQVSADNDAAVGLYRAMGFEPHHEYWYVRERG